MTDYQDLTLTVENRIAVLTFNLPESRNPISNPNTLDEIEAALGEVQANDDVSVLVLTGAGQAFSAGGNVKAMRQRTTDPTFDHFRIRDYYKRGIQRLPLAFDKVDVPAIAAINGAAMGGGLDLAMMCDMRLASTEAFMGETFLNLGIIPGDGGSWYLERLVGHQQATVMTLTAKPIKAEQALALGLVMSVLEPDQLMPEAMALARRIAAKPPRALRMAKRLLKQAEAMNLNDFLHTCAAAQALAQTSGDHREAVNAYFDQRDPVFQGR